MQAIPVSDPAGSSIAVENGQWVLTLPGGRPPLTDAANPAFWPLLERDPHAVLDLAQAPGAPPIPLPTIIESALRSGQPYWQEATLPWIRALAIEPSSSIGKTAAEVIAERHAGQQSRQQLERWLTGKPWR